LGKGQKAHLTKIDEEGAELQKQFAKLKEKQELIVISAIESLKVEGVKEYRIDLEEGKLYLTK
jgi:hypothetical protein